MYGKRNSVKGVRAKGTRMHEHFMTKDNNIGESNLTRKEMVHLLNEDLAREYCTAAS